MFTVSVGYEYESCPDLILWEKRTAVLQGYEIDASKLGGWSLDKHHALNIQSGRLSVTHSRNNTALQVGPYHNEFKKRKGKEPDKHMFSLVYFTNKLFLATYV